MVFSKLLNNHRPLKRLAKTLIRLRVCTGWSEALLVAHTTCTLLEILCTGSKFWSSQGIREWNDFVTQTLYLVIKSYVSVFYWGPDNECWQSSICYGMSIRLSVRPLLWILQLSHLSPDFKFIFRLQSPNSRGSLAQIQNNQDGRQNGLRISVCLLGAITKSFTCITWLLPNFVYAFLLILSHPSLQMGFVRSMYTNLKGRLNGTRLPFRTCGHIAKTFVTYLLSNSMCASLQSSSWTSLMHPIKIDT